MKKLFFLSVVLILANGSLPAQVNLDSGLVAYYPFSGNADDESGNGNNGTVMGAVLTTDRFGIDSAAYEFNGASTFITIPSSATLESPTTELSQVAWINLYSWSPIGQPFGPILMKSNSGGNAFQYRLSVGSGGINTAINNWNNGVTVPDTLNFNEWYFIVTTLKDDTVRAYVNGVFIGADTLVGPISPNSLPLEIGRDVPGVTEIFNGKIDDVRIYNRMITPEEIDSLYDEFTTSADVPTNSISRTFKLYQNYPNPFNPSTTIEFSLPSSEFVSLDVFNVAGQQVANLISDKLSAGDHKYEWTAGELASGVYLYKLQAGEYINMKKMILMK